MISTVHGALLSALRVPSGLIIVTGPAGQGKTTVIEGVLADPSCPPDIAFPGDVRDVETAQRAASLARSSVVVAVLRIQRASGAFGRLIDMGISPTEVSIVVRGAFSMRLCRQPSHDVVLLHEQLVVTDAVRALIVSSADSEAIHRQAMLEGMRSLRQAGWDQVRSHRLTEEAMLYTTPDD